MRGRREAEAAEERKGLSLVPHIDRNYDPGTLCLGENICHFTFGSEGGPRPPFNQAVEKKTLREKKELTTTKGGYASNHIKPISHFSV